VFVPGTDDGMLDSNLFRGSEVSRRRFQRPAPFVFARRSPRAHEAHAVKKLYTQRTRRWHPSNDESPVVTGLSEAAEGTRTLDLLHGKQTL
jgi:hypothetical protein